MEAFSFQCCLESKKEQNPADTLAPPPFPTHTHTQHCTPSLSNLCTKLLPENQRSALTQAHVQMQKQTKPDGNQGFVATESDENTVLPPIMPVILLCLLCHGELLPSIRLERL